MIKNLKIAALYVALPLAALSSAHGAVSLNFTLPDIPAVPNSAYEEILNYYNGGADFNGAVGPNYGIAFGSDALALANYPLSNTGNEPGGGNAMIFLSGPGDIMNVAAGFNTGFSFYYAAVNVGGSVTVYSGLDGTGTLLATLSFPADGFGPGPGDYSQWDAVGVSFAGTAESVDFSGTANQIAFADVTIGSQTVQVGNSVPDNTGLSIYALAGLGLAGVAWTSRKQGIATV